MIRLSAVRMFWAKIGFLIENHICTNYKFPLSWDRSCKTGTWPWRKPCCVGWLVSTLPSEIVALVVSKTQAAASSLSYGSLLAFCGIMALLAQPTHARIVNTSGMTEKHWLSYYFFLGLSDPSFRENEATPAMANTSVGSPDFAPLVSTNTGQFMDTMPQSACGKDSKK